MKERSTSATAKRGRLIKLDAAGNGTVVWSSAQPCDLSGGRLTAREWYRVQKNLRPGECLPFIGKRPAHGGFSQESATIWALASLPTGSLLTVPLDTQQRLSRTARGRGDLLYETGQGHVNRVGVRSPKAACCGQASPKRIMYRITGCPPRLRSVGRELAGKFRSIIPRPTAFHLRGGSRRQLGQSALRRGHSVVIVNADS